MSSTTFSAELDADTFRMPINVEVDAQALVYKEQYGEDADGNRGVMRTFIEDVNMRVYDSRGHELSSRLKYRYPDSWDMLLKKAEYELYLAFQREA